MFQKTHLFQKRMSNVLIVLLLIFGIGYACVFAARQSAQKEITHSRVTATEFGCGACR